MHIKDILFPADFLNLTKEDVKRITAELDITVNGNIDIKMHLFNIKDSLFENDDIADLITNKVLAGKTSVKWYNFDFKESEKNGLIEKLESESNFYNTIYPIDTGQITSPTKYTCIKSGDNTYIIRVMNPSGIRTVNNGRDINKIQTINNVTVVLDIEHKYIEVRSDSASARKIINDVIEPLLGFEIEENNILEKFDDSLEEFKSSLNEGKFVDVKSKPDYNIILSSNQNELLVNILGTLDEYFINKDVDAFIEELLEFDIGTDEFTFTQLFLAGLSQIGMATHIDSSNDLTNQSLYGILKAHMTNQSGFISFSIEDNEGTLHSYTILVGIKTTNSISFRSSATERAIEYVRNKILGF